MNRNTNHKPNRITTVVRAILFAALIIAASPTRLPAAVVLWTGGSSSSSDWSDSGNWLAGNVPMNGDDVVFGLNFRTTNFDNFFSLNINTLQFSAPAPAFTIHIIETSALTISGAGVINNSANIQTLINDTSSGDGPQVAGTTIFQNNATAGNLHIINEGGNFFVDGWGETVFEDTSNAGTAVITNEGPFGTGWGGLTFFRENSNAANATITNSGGISSNNTFGRSATEFSGSASASGATIINQAGQFGGATYFFGNSTADSATIHNNGAAAFGDEGGSTHFISGPFEIATAANATITNHGGAANNAVGGQARFAGVASAGSAMINNNGGTVGGFTGAALGGRTLFISSSTASSATINNNGGTVLFAGGGVTEFSDMSTASSATINNHGGVGGFAGGGVTEFFESSTAGNATITNNGATAANLAFGGETRFNDSSSASNATLIANGGTNGGAGGRIFFNGDSTGNHVRVEVFGNGLMDISGHNAPGVTVGSIAGSGNIFLGANRLVVGSNNINTSFSGVIQNGGLSGGSAGSLQKVGLGTLTLSGTNTYTGPTTVSVGALLVNGSITSAVTVNGGTLGGSGTTGAVTVNSGGTLAPGNSPGILNVQGDLALMMGSTYLVELNGTVVGSEYDQTNVTGTVSLDNATLSLSLGFTPTAGDMFTIINNDLGDMVTGMLDGLPDGATFTADGQLFSITYHGGDGNDVVLTSVIPEPRTWALILVGGLLVTCWRRKQIPLR